MFIALLTFGLGGRASAQCSNMTLSTSPPAWNGFEFCTGYDPSTIGAPVINYSGTCSTTPVYNYYWQRRVNGGAYTTVTQGLGVAAVPGFNPAAETNTPAGNPMNTVQWRLLVDDIANSLSAQSGNFTIYIYSNLQAAIAVTNTCTNTGALDLTVNGGASSLTYSWAPGGQTTEDISGLTQGTYTVTVTDGGSCPSITAVATVRMPDVPPVLPADQNVTIACPAQAFAPPSPIVVDACGISLTGILNNPAGTYNGCEGTIVFTWTFTDAYPHTVVWTKTYTVERDDFTMPADDGALVSCPAATNTIPTPPTVTDNCGQTITPTGPTVSSAPTCNGTRTYVWNYQDCEGNNHNWTYTYTVTYSGGLSIPPNDGQTVSCPALAVDPGAPASVTDACGRTVTPVLLSSGTIPSCEGTVAYVYRYTTCDNANYDWTYTYTIERNDFSMPLNDGSVVSCPADANTVPTPPSVTDNCGNNITPSGPSDSGPVSCNGTRVYTWNYQDCEGNNHDWTYTYTVNYSGGLTAPANTSSTIQCQTDAVDPGAPAPITDACGRTVNAVLVSSGGGPAICNGSVIWTYRYTACDGTTTADWTHTYNVVHSTPP
ncbi:MAG TPA: hypothetical protein PLP14_02345, partial [Chitinophagaceae bacterium]|nr:hypothetical protein [Chitinophagaceae bacterium]